LIQLALSWGAKVITTASTSAEFNFLQGLSTQIDRVIDLSSENFVNAIMEETNSMGVDLLIHSDVVKMGETPSSATCSFDLSSIPKRDYIKCLAPHGMWVTSTELQLDPPESTLLLLKSGSISFLCDQTWLLAPSQSGRLLHILSDLLDKVSRGLVRIKIAQTFSLERVRQALKELDTQVGCILVKPQ
jgi:NADPH:quinone reductase-like Zn-dependent oxidoreductase